MRLARRLLSALIMVGAAGCGIGIASSDAASPPAAASQQAPATAAPAQAPASGADSLASVQARLDRMLAAASHCTSDAECRSVAVGGKACGGPTGYRAYNAHLADPAAVQALAKQDQQLAMQAERESHRVSNCLFMADPGAHCEKQRCETGTIGPMSPNGGASTR